MTILSMYIDYLGIYTGNPLSYMNMHDFAVTLISASKWSLLKDFKYISTALLCEKASSGHIPLADLNDIDVFMKEYFDDDINQDAIKKAIISMLNSEYESVMLVESFNFQKFRIPAKEMLEFFYTYKLHRDDVHERF